MTAKYPQRIVCLTEETTETLYLLGAEDRIVGISGFTVRPARARKEKPRVSAFTSAKLDKIVALKPDLVLGFSDLQADIAADLVRLGIPVHVFNQRSVAEILQMTRMLGGMLGLQNAAEKLAVELEAHIAATRLAAAQLPYRPRLYFEEWDEPMISAIRWVSELAEIAGADDCFPELAQQSLGKNRIIEHSETVIERNPQLMIASWCGKKFNPKKVIARPGWQAVRAVQLNALHEIKSPIILQPGPAALTDGLTALRQIIQQHVALHPLEA